MKTLAAALTFTVLGTAAFAATIAQDRASCVLAETPGLFALEDNDGGRVEAFRHGQAARAMTYHGGAVVSDPTIQVVFLGDWSSPTAAGRKAELQKRVEQISGSSPFQATSDYGVRTSGLLVSVREISATGILNDLRIQESIAAAMAAGTLPLRDDNAIHLIFLAPGLSSTLGKRAGGHDYHSYHSHVQIDEVNLRYAVIPFDHDLIRISEAARQSLLSAIINPDGDGWY